MSIKYKCVDCQKEFIIDYRQCIPEIVNLKTEEEIKKKIEEYDQVIALKFGKNFCYECLQKILEKNEEESVAKEKVIKEIKQDEKMLYDDVSQAVKENELLDLDRLIEEEEIAFNELSDAKLELDKNMQTLDIVLAELRRINKEEKEAWSRLNNFEKKVSLDIKHEKYEQIKNENIQAKIKQFSQSNVFTDLFQITFTNKVGTINYCRMQLPVSGNSYDELNAGWGNIVFLTCILAQKFQFKSKLTLEPTGSYSKIRDESGKAYDLSLSELSRTIPNFNQAMTLYLQYFDEFIQHLNICGVISKFSENKGITTCEFNFVIKNDTINGKSICYDSTRPGDWCQCMKFLLAELKFLMTMALMDEDEKYKNILEIANIINPYNSRYSK